MRLTKNFAIEVKRLSLVDSFLKTSLKHAGPKSNSLQNRLSGQYMTKLSSHGDVLLNVPA